MFYLRRWTLLAAKVSGFPGIISKDEPNSVDNESSSKDNFSNGFGRVEIETPICWTLTPPWPTLFKLRSDLNAHILIQEAEMAIDI